MNSSRASDLSFDPRLSGFSPDHRAPSKGAFRDTLKRAATHEAAIVVAVVMAPVAVALLAAF
jgi:hypothetical protein